MIYRLMAQPRIKGMSPGRTLGEYSTLEEALKHIPKNTPWTIQHTNAGGRSPGTCVAKSKTPSEGAYYGGLGSYGRYLQGGGF